MAHVSAPFAEDAEKRLRTGRRVYLAENAVATIIFSLGSGNFIAGLLSWLGATPSVCALVGAFPQLGCIMQLVSPFLFERLKKRKGCIILCCFCFRFFLGCAGVMPLLLAGNAIGAVMPIYLVAFLMAGFVTPGLNQWIMDLAPTEKRGSFFARRDILSAVVNAASIMLMSRLLDAMVAAGRVREGYLIVFLTVMVLSVIDAVLLARVPESRESTVVKLNAADLLRPLRDKKFAPIVRFIVLWFFAQNLSSGFLSVYQLTVLGLDHSMIATMMVISSVVGICMSWVWGYFADKVGWKRLLICACVLLGVGNIGWFLLPTSMVFLAPVLQCITTAGNGAYGMANLNIQYASSPAEGKTAYLGVTAALSNLIGYAAVFLGAQLQPMLAQQFLRAGIPVLFIASAVGFAACILYTRKIADL